MWKNKLIYKVLGIIAATLCTGFSVMGVLTLWMQYRASMELQTHNSRNTAAIIAKSIADSMMKGEAKEVDGYIREMKEKKFVRELKIFGPEGKESKNPGAGINQTIVQAISTGKPLETDVKRDGENLLIAAIPLANEARCKGCHDAAPKFLGAILLDTSIQEGYEMAINLSIMLSVVGAVFFFLMLAGMYFFFKRTIVRDILECSRMVNVLAQGEGDLTTEFPVKSEDEIGQLVMGINKLNGKLREIISDLYSQAEHIAVSVCKVKQGTGKTVLAAADQKEQSMSVAV